MLKIEKKVDEQAMLARPSNDNIKAEKHPHERGNYDAYNKWLSERHANRMKNAGLG